MQKEMVGIERSPLFKGIDREEIHRLLGDVVSYRRYRPEEVLALRGDVYTHLWIVCDGVVRGEMINHLGEKMVVEEIEAPRMIAPAVFFATENRLPVDVIVQKESVIATLRREDFTRLLQSNSQVLTNFLQSISDRSKFLSDRVRMLRFGTIKSKLAGYLLELSAASTMPIIHLPVTHQELADMFGVTRPALSRALSQLAADGAIDVNKSTIRVIDKMLLKRVYSKEK